MKENSKGTEPLLMLTERNMKGPLLEINERDLDSRSTLLMKMVNPVFIPVIFSEINEIKKELLSFQTGILMKAVF